MTENDRPEGGMTDNMGLHDVARDMDLAEAEAEAERRLTEAEAVMQQRFPEMIETFTRDRSGKLITFPNRGPRELSLGEVLTEREDASPRETLCYALPLDIDEDTGRETAHIVFFPDGFMARVEDRHGEEEYQEEFGASEEPYDVDAGRVHDYKSAKGHWVDMHHRQITHRSDDVSHREAFDEFLDKAFTNAKENPPQPRQRRVRRTIVGMGSKAISAFDRHYPGANPSSGGPPTPPAQE